MIQMQTEWAKQLNPLLALLPCQGQLLPSIVLINGTTSINHKLGRTLIGWFLTRVRGSATIYDAQDTNPLSDKTLLLVSNAGITVDIWVF